MNTPVGWLEQCTALPLVPNNLHPISCHLHRYTEQPVTSLVVTVPSYYNQAARKAILLAGEMADVKIMRLMSTSLAASLNYGVFRRKEFTAKERYIAIYDMGSSSTVAAVAAFYVAKDKDSKEQTPHVEIRGIG